MSSVFVFERVFKQNNHVDRVVDQSKIGQKLGYSQNNSKINFEHSTTIMTGTDKNYNNQERSRMNDNIE